VGLNKSDEAVTLVLHLGRFRFKIRTGFSSEYPGHPDIFFIR
jgi:hypothetical protein